MVDILFPGIGALQNLHPLFVHFPIAFFTGALLMEGIAIVYDEKCHLVATWMLYLAALTAVVTLITGFIAEYSLAAADPMGHHSPAHDPIHVHRNWMVTATFFGLSMAGYFFWINHKKRWATHYWRLFLGLILLVLVVSMGADRGARLVYEFGSGINPNLLKEAPHEEHPEGDHH